MNKKPVIVLIAALMFVSVLSLAFGAPTPRAGAKDLQTATSSVYTGPVAIYANGTVSAPGVFSRAGNTYTLLQNVSGEVLDLRNNSAINGNGFAVSIPNVTAIVIPQVTNVSIRNILITNSNTGIYFYNVTNCSATGVTTESTPTGISVYYSNGVSLSDSRLNASSTAVFVAYSNSVHVANVDASNLTSIGFSFQYTSGVNIQNTTSSTATHISYGILLQEGSNFVARNNKVDGATYGFDVFGGSNVQFADNVVTNSGYGIDVYEVTGFASSHDSLSGATSYGAAISYVSNATLQYDNFSNSQYGVQVTGGYNLAFLNSDFSNVTASGAICLLIGGANSVNISFDKFYDTAGSIYGVNIGDTGQATLYHDYLYTPSGTGVYLYYLDSLFMNSSYDYASSPFQTATTTIETIFTHDTFAVQGANTALHFYGNTNSNILVSDSTFYASPPSTSLGVFTSSRLSSNVMVVNNHFYGFTVPVRLSPVYGSNNSIINNTMVNSSTAIVAFDSSRVNISYNHIDNVGTEGILMQSTSSSTIAWNTILLNSTTNYATGIGASSLVGAQTLIYNNTIVGNASRSSSHSTQGISLAQCVAGQSMVADNTITSVFLPMVAEYDTNLTLTGNVATSGGYGIYSYNNANYEYYGNEITNMANNSFFSIGDSNGAVFANTFQNASSYMLNIQFGSFGTFYHNNFLNGSSVGTYFYANSQLFWNLALPVGGNYWSNYTGTGVNGIGTTPYTVNGTNVDQYPLTSRWTSPTVSFIETGLPSGTVWSVTLGTETMQSAGSSIVFYPSNVQPFNESYSIGAVPGYNAAIITGTVSLNGSSKVILLAFAPVTYAITFTESGLKSGTSWSVTMNGTTETSTTPTIIFNEPNGTYSYTIDAVSGYTGGDVNGTVTVNGVPLAETGSYTLITYMVTVVEGGLPSGSSWTADFTGSGGASYSVSSTGTSAQIALAPGTYTVNVTGPSGYRVTLQASSLTITNSSSALVAQFASTAHGTVSNSNSIYEGLGIGVIVGAIAGALVAIFIASSARRGRQGKQQ